MKASFLITSCAVAFCYRSVSAQVQQTWAALEGPQQESGLPAARVLGLDGLGNVYVTGAGTTVKYSAAGSKLWSAGATNGSHNVLAVDGAGNLYLSGSAYDATFDYITSKYSPNGIRLWFARYDGGGEDVPAAIALDGAGNVYVTGTSRRAATGQDYLTVKYGANGNQLWIAHYDGSAHGDDSPKAIALDAAGRLYVTGTSKNTNDMPGYATIAYDSNGNQLWMARYDANEPFSYSYARALAIDNAGNVYVTGASGPGYPYHYLTVKYDHSGNELWVAPYGGDKYPSSDDPNAIKVDDAGNVYVTGGLYRTVKYDSDGKELWVTRYNGPTNAAAGATTVAVSTDLALDGAGNTYVTGYAAYDGGGFDGHWVCATAKYDANGNQLWVANYGANPRNFGTGIEVNEGGNVFVAGYSGFPPPPNGNYNYSTLTLKYAQTAAVGSPVITSEPQGQTVLAGTNVVLSVQADGAAPLSYQWRLFGTDILGATNDTLTFTNVQTSQNGEYSVRVTNSVGWTVSPDVRLVVNAPPHIITQPENQTVFEGDYAMFSVEVEGWPFPNLQWRLNGTNLAGQNYGQLILWSTTAADAGGYTLIASNAVGSVTSEVAVLIVVAQAPSITVQPLSRSAYLGDDVYFSVQATAHPPPVYQWQMNETNIVSATNSGLGLGNVGTNQAGNYRVIVSNYLGAVTSEVATLTVSLQAPTIFLQPRSQTAIQGTTVGFSVLAEARPPPTYQWTFDAVPIAGRTNSSLTLSNVTRNSAGGYAVVISNSVGVSTSAVAILTVNYPGPLDDWRVRTLPTPVSLNAVTYVNGRFAAVGDGVVVTSSNGVNWTSRTIANSLLLHGITWGNGLYVVVGYDNSIGNSAIWTSSNLVNWTSRNPGTRAFLNGVSYGNGTFVTAGGYYDSTILSSTNGIDWINRQTGTAYSLGRPVFGSGLFVASGFARVDLPASFLSSADGVNWDSTGFLPAWMGIGSLAFGRGDALVAVGINFSGSASGYYGLAGRVSLSENSFAVSLITNALYDVAYGDGYFVAVGVNGTILSSLDGYYWMPRVSPTAGYLSSITYGKGTFVAVGPSGTVFQSGYVPVVLNGRKAPGGGVDLTITGGVEGNYRLQATSDLGSGLWTTLAAYNVVYTNVQATVQFSGRTTENTARRFYRVVSP